MRSKLRALWRAIRKIWAKLFMSETEPLRRWLDVSVNVEKTAGGGEDAEPLLWCSKEGSQQVIGVFDGLGGAGSILYGDLPEQHTGAYYASRSAREIVREFFHEESASGDDGEDFGILSALEDNLRRGLKKRAEDLTRGGSASRLKSTLIRTLPTTIAMIQSCRRESGNDCRVEAIWAGDSRAFHLHPTQGLQQLSRDDLVSGGDPLENLINDSPLSNYLSADGNFHLNSSTFFFPLPTVLLVATDGCFGYVPTPIHFEYLLLESLDRASSSAEWQVNLARRFVEIAGDDASLALIAVGWEAVEDVQQAFRARFAALKAEYIKAHDELVAELADMDGQWKALGDKRDRWREKVQRSREMIWGHYCKGYMYHLSKEADLEPAGSSAEPPDRKAEEWEKS